MVSSAQRRKVVREQLDPTTARRPCHLTPRARNPTVGRSTNSDRRREHAGTPLPDDQGSQLGGRASGPNEEPQLVSRYRRWWGMPTRYFEILCRSSWVPAIYELCGRRSRGLRGRAMQRKPRWEVAVSIAC